MKSKRNFKEIITHFMNKSKKDTITIVVLIGILLLVITIPTKKDTGQKGSDGSVAAASENENISGENKDTAESTKQYETYLEKRIVEILTKTEGVGNVKVMVTLKNTSEKILAENKESSNEELTETDASGGSRTSKKAQENSQKVTTQDKSGSSPYVTGETMPEVEGVVVVAQGGGDGRVAADITAAVEALFGIAPHKIKVLKMS